MKTYLKIACLGLAALFAAWSSTALAEVKASPEVQSSGKLSVANTLDYAPFEYLDADGKQTGIIVELAGVLHFGRLRQLGGCRHADAPRESGDGEPDVAQ